MIGMGTTIFLVNPQTFGGGSSAFSTKSILLDGVDERVNVGTGVTGDLVNVSSIP